MIGSWALLLAATQAVTSPALPREVVAFRRKRDLCDHFRGEHPYDAERAAFLLAAMNRNCRGTDRALRRLRARHAKRPEVLKALAGYDDGIEP